MRTWHLVVDVALCQGCNNCFLACKDEHVGNDWPGYARAQALHGERWIEIPCKERGQYPLIDVAYRPTLCAHCGDAPCVSRSGGAIRKRGDGIVLIDPTLAAGRRELVEACPYGMIVWNEESQTPQKCTLCAHLLDTGWSEPRCVQACGPGALSVVYEDEESFRARAAKEGLVQLYRARGRKGACPDRPEPVDPGTVVYYKNLWRFESSFIAGSVAWQREGVVDCAAGIPVTLRRVAADSPGTGDDAVSETHRPSDAVITVYTDAFGDFWFDRLEPDSGEYEVEVAAPGYRPVAVCATLGSSLNVGTIVLEPAATGPARTPMGPSAHQPIPDRTAGAGIRGVRGQRVPVTGMAGRGSR